MKKTKANFVQMGVEDLVMLPKVTEEAIIENLQKRYMQDLIYTNIGPVLISINPYRNLGIGTPEYVHTYQGRFRHELPPHIFALAEETYRAMKGEGMNQCVIISGESGAGKTEAAKLIMQYISAVSGSSAAVEYVKHVIMESNPLLEAFGNAKTLRNNNSSRFGKYFEIKFDRVGDPCGGRITNYLLEKSRVVFQTPGERNFHAFYQLLSGASQQQVSDFSLYDAEYFHYVNQSGCFRVDGTDDRQEFADTCNAMNVIGVDPNTQQDLWRTLAAILHLGNVSFLDDGKGGASVADKQILEFPAYLLGIEPFALENALLFRVVNTSHGSSGRGSTYNVPQNVEQAGSARDALAKAIYDRMFDWIVGVVNEALQRGHGQEYAVIGVLDIFGFEIFQHNGFEQFCINYVNEKLQQYFIELTLKAEQEEYNAEGIKWTPIDYFNNKIVCDLIEEKAPPGIFSILDDVCYTMHAGQGDADGKFLAKVNGAHERHKHFRAFSTAFEVKHYAGDVQYEIAAFVDKNKDTLFADLIEAMQTSSSQYVLRLFPDDLQADSKKRPTTAGFKIKNSAGLLMKTLSASIPHYIRCIKPNETKSAQSWDAPRCKHQVKYLGLYENVRVRRAGFAYRAPFQRFLDRYKRLSRKTWGMWGEWTGGAIEGCKTLLTDLGIDPAQFQMGKTKVFIRHPETLFYLEEGLERRDFECSVKLQRAWRKWKLLKHSLEQRMAVANIYKGRKERQRDSIHRSFTADYINYDHNGPMQQVVTRGELLQFADQIIKLNRRGRPERRDFIITDRAIYLLMRKKKPTGEVFYETTRRTNLSDVRVVMLSELADNYICISVPASYDYFFENERKTEIVSILMERVPNLQVNFTNSIQYKIKSETGGLDDTRTQQFQSGGGGSVVLQKTGKTITAQVPAGLPRDTDSAPQNFQSQRGSAKRVAPPAGTLKARGRAAVVYETFTPRGGASPAAQTRGATSSPAARGGASSGSAPTRGAPPGRGAPPARGGPGGPASGPAAARGGPGGPASGPAPGRGAPAGGPPRGGPAPGPARGGPASGPAPGRGAPGGATPGAAARGGPASGPAPGRGAPGGAAPGAARGGAPGRGTAPPGRGAPGPGRGAAAAPTKPTATMLWAYTAQSHDELSVAAGAVVTILSPDDGGWLEAEFNGKRGLLPSNYISPPK